MNISKNLMFSDYTIEGSSETIYIIFNKLLF